MSEKGGDGMARCKGRKDTGTPCDSTDVLDNGYCQAHQDQATQPYRWTRERLEDAIQANGGTEGLDLRGGDFSGRNLDDMDLRGVILSDANLRGASLARARLPGADLQRANLCDAQLVDADLTGANLTKAQLRLACLDSGTLTDANLRGTDLQGARLRSAKLREAKLYDTNLQRAYMVEADLGRAKLYRSVLREARLSFANLEGASLTEVDLRKADLSVANLQSALVVGADLQGASLYRADLREADLRDLAEGGLLEVRLYRSRLGQTELQRGLLGSSVLEERQGKYREAQEVYWSLKQNFESLGDYEAAGWSYIKERQMEKTRSAPWHARGSYGEEQLGDTSEDKLPSHHPRVLWFFARHTAKWLSDWVVELACNYGEGPGRTLATIAVIYGLFTLLYWRLGGVMQVHETSLGVVRERVQNLTDVAVFSFKSMVAMDPVGVEPGNRLLEVLTALQALLGIGLTGLFGFVLGNRIRRS